MTDAVIVSTARTGLAKSWRGALNMTHGATMGGHVVRHAIERAKIDPAEVERLIVDYGKEIGAPRRKIGDEEIVQRLIFALVNEGAAILHEGIASRASDIDMVYLTGYGFPLHRGGPMLYADVTGLYNVVRTMQRFASNPHGDPAFWKPAPLLATLAAEGKTFN